MIHESRNLDFDLIGAGPYVPRLSRRILLYIRWRKINGMPPPSAHDIKGDIKIKSLRHTQQLLHQMEEDGLIRRYLDDRTKLCEITNKGEEFIFKVIQHVFDPETLPKIRRLWLSV